MFSGGLARFSILRISQPACSLPYNVGPPTFRCHQQLRFEGLNLVQWTACWAVMTPSCLVRIAAYNVGHSLNHFELWGDAIMAAAGETSYQMCPSFGHLLRGVMLCVCQCAVRTEPLRTCAAHGACCMAFASGISNLVSSSTAEGARLSCFHWQMPVEFQI